ncbi:DUF1127 domain-containing protein [Roseovarius aestuarii]|uniref:YjiS-like domain-containing protein n=1 Tax=Roseovarius aestuarii TaxID=475083 RepID=A0A1X7BMI6_9RHOB|nr:DUF1127 domain-containing protein [Roseovarius aestuarii]SMC10730.1 hypothetical protein ROA7745_00537 [Roseovarius aestuarii]
MAVIDTTRTHAATGIIGDAVAKFTAAFTAWFDARATRKALSQLSERELDDIGLSRADISRIGIYH